MSMLFIIAGLSLIKKFMKLLSGFIGAADANETGKDVAESVKSVGMKAGVATLGAAGIGVGAGVLMAKGYGALGKKLGVGKLGDKIRDHRAASKAAKEEKKNKKKEEEYRKQYTDANGVVDEEKVKRAMMYEGMFGKGSEHHKAENKARLKKVGLVIGGALAVAALGPMAIGALTGKKKVTEKKPVYEKDDKGNFITDEKGDKVIKKDKDGNAMYEEVQTEIPAFKAFGQGLLDLGGSTMKLAGDITGLSGLIKAFGEAGGIDKAKEGIVRFGQGIGTIKTGVDGKAMDIPKWLKTKSQTDQEDKDALKAQQTAVTEMKGIQEKTLEELKKLIKSIDEKKK